MSTTLKATGDFHAGEAPTLSISSGRGNTDAEEVHLILRDEAAGSTRSLMAWFNKAEMLAAIEKTERKAHRLVEAGESA